MFDISSSSISASAIGNPFTYTGRRLDEESGLYYYRARHYSADLKRFIQRDPLEYVDGPNAYGYVGARAPLRNDPTGLDSEVRVVQYNSDGTVVLEYCGVLFDSKNPITDSASADDAAHSGRYFNPLYEYHALALIIKPVGGGKVQVQIGGPIFRESIFDSGGGGAETLTMDPDKFIPEDDDTPPAPDDWLKPPEPPLPIPPDDPFPKLGDGTGDKLPLDIRDRHQSSHEERRRARWTKPSWVK